jgi:hypothetical protein
MELPPRSGNPSGYRRVDIDALKDLLAGSAQAVAKHLLPGGKATRHELRAGSIDGEPGESLIVRLAGRHAGFWIDHATDEKGGMLDLWMKTRRLTFGETLADIRRWLGADLPRQAGGCRPEPAAIPPERELEYIGPGYNTPWQNWEDAAAAAKEGFDGGDPELLEKIARAWLDWEKATPIPGTVGEIYLRNRIAGLVDDFAFNDAALRYEPASWHPFLQDHCQAVIAKVVRAHDAQFCGVQRIYLLPDGSNRLPDKGRLSFGRLTGGVVKLSPERCEDGVLVITEGVVKGLALIDIGAPGVVAAALGTSALATLPFMPGVSRLTIVRDNDDAGVKAADTLARRYRHRNTPVRVVGPPQGKDTDAFLRGEQ